MRSLVATSGTGQSLAGLWVGGCVGRALEHSLIPSVIVTCANYICCTLTNPHQL